VQGVRYQNLSNTATDMKNSFFSIYQKNDKKDDKKMREKEYFFIK
jgi:hypothetical protein